MQQVIPTNKRAGHLFGAAETELEESLSLLGLGIITLIEFSLFPVLFTCHRAICLLFIRLGALQRRVSRLTAPSLPYLLP